MPTSNIPMYLSKLPYHIAINHWNDGAWRQVDGGDFFLGEGTATLAYVCSKGIIMLDIILLSDEELEPWCGMYRMFGSAEIVQIGLDQDIIERLELDTLDYIDMLTLIGRYWEYAGEGSRTHAWPEGYATLEDLMAACQIPFHTLQYLTLPKA